MNMRIRLENQSLNQGFGSLMSKKGLKPQPLLILVHYLVSP